MCYFIEMKISIQRKMIYVYLFIQILSFLKAGVIVDFPIS